MPPPPPPQICKADKCVYRNTQTLVSNRKHYHATCSHIHQVISLASPRDGEKKEHLGF